jgi:hypothetical protein
MSVSDRSSEMGAAPDGSGADNHVHVTFSFHCAAVRLPDKRRTDVLLAPGMRHGVPNGAAANGHTDHGGSNGAATMHQAEHIASLRVPGDCIEKDGTGEGLRQITARLDRADVEDVTWRLEGYDVTLRTGGGLRATSEPPANITFTTAADDVTYMVADFPRLAGLKIDPACYADGDEFPASLRKGARVRLNGGTLECGVPSGPLKERRWKVGTAENVGLSDRMEYRKDLSGDGRVELIFRKFDEDEKSAKTVYLKPGADGIVRIHVSNDPFAEDPPQGSRQIDPCSALKHFASYALLLYPAGEDKSDRLPPPTALGSGAGNQTIVTEGSNTACCPCGSDGGGNP